MCCSTVLIIVCIVTSKPPEPCRPGGRQAFDLQDQCQPTSPNTPGNIVVRPSRPHTFRVSGWIKRTALPFDDPHRPQARDLAADGGAVEYVDNLLHVFVGVGLLLLQTRPTPRPGDHAAIGQLALD